jgi:CrcB protein
VTDHVRSPGGPQALKPLLAVFAGGLVGTSLRLGADALLGDPIGTLIVNVAGSFVLGLLVSVLWSRAPEWMRAGLGAGLLGSFTTFSALAVVLLRLPLVQAAGYLVITLGLGFGAALIGLRIGRRPTPIDAVNE